MSKYWKITTLAVLLPSLFLFVFFALSRSGLMSWAAQQIVVPKPDDKTSGSKDSINLRTFGYATLTPEGSSDGGGGGDAGAPGAPHWPFKDKSPSQFNRIDGGWDLQYKTTTDVLAVLPGKIYNQRTLSHASGGGFGGDYPVVKLDTPLSVKVSGKDTSFIAIYYGHVHMKKNLKDGDHVNAGDPIATTDPNGVGGAPPNWVEVGFDKGTANPVGGSGAGTPVGFAICDWLHGAKCPSK